MFGFIPRHMLLRSELTAHASSLYLHLPPMEFLYPAFLTALVAVAIPIIVHLFNFRRFKKIYFPNVKFIEEIQERTKSHSQLKHLLVMACRILAIAALVLAFARPFIPSPNSTQPAGEQAISIYLNNSFSMEAEAENGPLLEIAKERIRNIVDAHDETDRYQLLTNDLEGRHQRLVSRDEFLDLLEEVQYGPFQRNISEVMTRQKDALMADDAPRKKAYVLSDLQRTQLDAAEWPNDSSINTVLVPLRANTTANLYVDSIWFEEPVRQLDRPDKLNVRIVNTSEELVLDRSLYLHINGQQRALASFSVPAQSSVDTSLAFTNTSAGIQQGRVGFSDQPITFDDELFFSFEVAGSIGILEVLGSESDASLLQPMFKEEDLYRLTTQPITGLDPSLIPQNDLLVLHGVNDIPSGIAQAVQQFMGSGGSVLLFPGTEIDKNAFNSFLDALTIDRILDVDTNNTKVSQLDLQAPMFKDLLEEVERNMDLPKVSQHYRLQSAFQNSRRDLMQLQNGDPFLSSFGQFYLSSVPLDTEWSNLTRHAFFVAIVLRAAELSTPSGTIYNTIGSEEAIIADDDGSTTLHIVQEGKLDMIPEVRRNGERSELFVHNQIREAGNYELMAATEQIGGLAFNYDRSASNMDPVNSEELEAMIQTNGLQNVSVSELESKAATASLLQELDEGKQLWRWFIVLALVFLGLETALIRFWK